MREEKTIVVENITKSFKIYYDKGSTLKEKLLFSKRRKYEKRDVLTGISFEAKKGEAIGLIGHNGCGKSTTLKLLTKIMYPDSGKIEMTGRVSSLIELGAGFHPDMSGRENIYINASIFGLTRKEIESRIDDIIEFSELEAYMDNPVRTYSSGMYMRLAFAVAINVDADILLIDEILAVGDATFQAKCFNKLREIKAKGTTIIIVSHSLSQLEQICDRCIWIDAGEIRMEGNPVDVDYAYLEFMGKNARKNIKIEEKTKEKTEDDKQKEQILNIEKESIRAEEQKEQKELEITGAEMMHENREIDTRFQVGEKVILKIKYKKNTPIENSLMGLKIYRNDETNAYGTNTQNERIKLEINNEGWIECSFEKFNLVAAQYYIDIAFRSQDMLIYDYRTKILAFETYNSVYEEGIAHLDHSWSFKGEK